MAFQINVDVRKSIAGLSKFDKTASSTIEKVSDLMARRLARVTRGVILRLPYHGSGGRGHNTPDSFTKTVTYRKEKGMRSSTSNIVQGSYSVYMRRIDRLNPRWLNLGVPARPATSSRGPGDRGARPSRPGGVTIGMRGKQIFESNELPKLVTALKDEIHDDIELAGFRFGKLGV